MTGRTGARLRRVLALTAGILGLVSKPAYAAPEAQVRASAQPEARPHARVLSEQAHVYSGPGFGFRVIAVAESGDVLEMIERGKRGGWTRVRLDSGLTGWILSEQVLIFGADPGRGEKMGPFRRFGRRLRSKVLGPPNLLTARFGGALSAGALGVEGLFLVRPSAFISPNVAVEAYLGPSVGRETNRGLFGLGANVYISPRIPFSVFVSAGTGAVYTKGKVDSIRDAAWSYLLSPGGGFWIIFKRNVGIRFDVRNHILFRADTAVHLQEYSGALAFTF